MSVKIGDQIEVTFKAARDGGEMATTRLNGRVAFSDHERGLIGDTWLVEVSGENPRQTVYFLTPIRLIKSADGLEKIIGTVKPYEVAAIRTAHALVTASEEACAPDSVGLGTVVDRCLR